MNFPFVQSIELELDGCATERQQRGCREAAERQQRGSREVVQRPRANTAHTAHTANTASTLCTTRLGGPAVPELRTSEALRPLRMTPPRPRPAGASASTAQTPYLPISPHISPYLRREREYGTDPFGRSLRYCARWEGAELVSLPPPGHLADTSQTPHGH